ncbi:hypothetical protein LLEC1_07221 [Akanthomyces lecanii]|uniref:GRIP domain-containing protein n=1 Tax=Cordyceps confragosa TaxID=2714763 RepID=A0A179ITV8_CORDF|nr:hypothetical protein LLEC1_07221 [Akanthomyces lecanii]
MFQRIRGAIDRTIAEEQARQRSDDAPTSRSGSNSSRQGASTGRRSRPNNGNTDAAEAPPNPDPAVFEAAFVIDDSDEASRAGTPKPAVPEKDALASKEATSDDGDTAADHGSGQRTSAEKPNHAAISAGTLNATAASRAGQTELSPEIKQQLLRSYRVAHKRATSIEPFEKALRENTPLASIADPDAMIEYLNQLNLRGDMVMDELKRVSAEKEEIKKKQVEAEESLNTTKNELEKALADGKKDSEKDAQPAKPAGKESGEDLFSYEDEIPQLQADVQAKADEIERLKTQVTKLENELSAAKETGDGLAVSLEQATKELGESRDAAKSQVKLQNDVDSRVKEIEQLTGKLKAAEAGLKKLQDSSSKDTDTHASKAKEAEVCRAAAEKRATELDAALVKAKNATSVSKNLIDDLKAQVEKLNKEKSEKQTKFDELTMKLNEKPSGSLAPTSETTDKPAAPAAASGGSKKKNKKKKGKGAAAAQSVVDDDAESKASEPAKEESGADSSALQAEIDQLKEEIKQKDAEIERLSKKRKSEEDLQEEIETLRDNLVNIGQDHVDDKEKLKSLEQEKKLLKADVEAAQAKLKSSTSSSEESDKVRGEMDALQKEYDGLREKFGALQSDLGAAQQLAQTRFKHLSELKEVLQKAQPELKSLRQESATLKTTKEELADKVKELKEMEKKEKELKKEIASAQQLATERATEIENLKGKLSQEISAKQKLEETQRVSGRDLRRAEASKVELSAKAEKAEAELQKLQDEVKKLRPRVKELEEQMHKFKREKSAAQEEAEFKSQQYINAQALLSSMRDQTTEMSVQLKESKSQAEAVEEELAEVQKLLQERTREGETMRRLLSDVDERADGKVREMRSRMEAAIEERERIEDESSTLARKRSRETEELKQKLRELEREIKNMTQERDDLDEKSKEWRRRRDELEAIEERASAEAEEMRTTASQLRSALDASENQVRDGEKQRADLRKMLDDSRQRYEKIAKDLKAAQSKLVSSPSRTSIDSNRSGTTNGASGGGADTTYLKTILLQFLEQKDGRLRAQLVPVLGKLLKFDKSEEEKWSKAVQHLEVR